MIEILKYSLILTFVILLLSCQPENESLTETEKAEIEDQIKQLASELFDSWNKAEYAQYLNYYSNSNEFTFAANGKITRSWLAFSDTVKAHTDPLENSKVEVINQYIDIVERNLVIVTELFDWSAIYKSGKQENMRGTYTTIYARHNKEWNIIYVAESFPGEF